MTADELIATRLPEDNIDEAEPRPIGGLLLIGLIALPILFVWLLLRPGYARSTRIVAFIYAFWLPVAMVLMWIADRLMRAWAA